MATLKRPQQAIFIDVSPTATPDYRLCGVYTDDLSIAYNPVTEESQSVVDTASTTEVTGYALNVPVSTKVIAATGQRGFKLSDYVNDLRKSLATAGEAETTILMVDLYDKTGTEPDFAYATQKFVGNIAIDTYGGPAGEALNIEYTIYINGDPINGTSTITTEAGSGDLLAAFTATV